MPAAVRLVLVSVLVAVALPAGGCIDEQREKLAEQKRKALYAAEAEATEKANAEAAKREAEEQARKAEEEKRRLAKELKKAQAGCKKKKKKACLELGRIWAEGKGVDADARKGFGFWSKACDLKSGEACALAGAALMEGVAGGKPDPEEAREMFAQGCGRGHAGSCVAKGQLDRAATGLRGKKAKKAKKAALAAFEKACDKGEGAGCFYLGAMLLDGEGTRADPAKAKARFQDACDKGDGNGCVSLAQQLAKAKKPDEAALTKLVARACELGVQEACAQ